MAQSGILTTRDVTSLFETFCEDRYGLSSADAGFYPSGLYEQFIATRATDILEEQRRTPNQVNKSTQQTLGCVSLEEVAVEECPCAPPSGCTWQRTTLPLPSMLGNPISVTGIGGNLQLLQHYTYRDWTSVKYSLSARILAEQTRGYYCIKNNYPYVVSPVFVHALAISGQFYDPVETQRFPSCGVVDYCSPFLDFPLYIDSSKYQKIIAATFQLVAGMRHGNTFDTTNNAQPPTALEPVKPY